MSRVFVATGRTSTPAILTEEQARHQLSASEEMLYAGYVEPALLAAGAALETALRLRAAGLVGPAAAPPALMQALLAGGDLGEHELEPLSAAIEARDLLAQGYVCPATMANRPAVALVNEVTVRLLEGLPTVGSTN